MLVNCEQLGAAMTAEEIISKLTEFGNNLAVAESLTGGLLLSELISVPGASAVVSGGVVCYSTASKIEVLGVSPKTISDFGVISAQTAEAMAQLVRLKFSTQFGLATTGVAGPDLQEEKPVGRVVIAVASSAGVMSEVFDFDGSRNQIRVQSVAAALDLLGKYSGNLPSDQGVN